MPSLLLIIFGTVCVPGSVRQGRRCSASFSYRDSNFGTVCVYLSKFGKAGAQHGFNAKILILFGTVYLAKFGEACAQLQVQRNG